MIDWSALPTPKVAASSRHSNTESIADLAGSPRCSRWRRMSAPTISSCAESSMSSQQPAIASETSREASTLRP